MGFVDGYGFVLRVHGLLSRVCSFSVATSFLLVLNYGLLHGRDKYLNDGNWYSLAS